MGLKDRYGRTIDYLRISVTDKCNLRCQYCMPKEGVALTAHEEILTLEEIYRLVTIFTALGIKKIRLTGGEPLVRKNIIQLVAQMHQLQGVEEIGMTTNGVLLAEQVEAFYKAGLTSVNISLDTRNKERFEKITGSDVYARVCTALEKAVQLGMHVKINCVPCKELNEQDWLEIALLAKIYPVDVRFIELMPIGCGKQFTGIDSDELQTRLEREFGASVPFLKKRGNGPARYVSFEQFQGKIGFISPMSHQFCADCNRVRLTAEGRLKLCLHYDRGIELKPLLRGGMTDAQITQAIEQALAEKPKEHDFQHTAALQDSDSRKMFQIGG